MLLCVATNVLPALQVGFLASLTVVGKDCLLSRVSLWEIFITDLGPSHPVRDTVRCGQGECHGGSDS